MWLPPRSPDFNQIEFYPWGFLAARVFGRRLQSIIDIKEAVSYFAASIVPEIVTETVKNFCEQENLC